MINTHDLPPFQSPSPFGCGFWQPENVTLDPENNAAWWRGPRKFHVSTPRDFIAYALKHEAGLGRVLGIRLRHDIVLNEMRFFGWWPSPRTPHAANDDSAAPSSPPPPAPIPVQFDIRPPAPVQLQFESPPPVPVSAQLDIKPPAPVPVQLDIELPMAKPLPEGLQTDDENLPLLERIGADLRNMFPAATARPQPLKGRRRLADKYKCGETTVDRAADLVWPPKTR
jgi:hypothetical protein